MNIDDFLKSVQEYSDANEGASIDDFLQSITLMRDIDSMSEEDFIMKCGSDRVAVGNAVGALINPKKQ